MSLGLVLDGHAADVEQWPRRIGKGTSATGRNRPGLANSRGRGFRCQCCADRHRLLPPASTFSYCFLLCGTSIASAMWSNNNLDGLYRLAKTLGHAPPGLGEDKKRH